VLGAAMPNQMQPLSGSMLVEQDAVYTISFAGAPVGDYILYCLPHLAMGMKGVLTVTQ
jgi:plastocyanin